MLILLEKGFQRDRVGQLSAFDQLAAGFKNAAVAAIGEMFRAQDIRHTLIGGVVVKHRAEQGCFCLEVMRSHAFEHHIGAVTVVYIKRSK